MPLKTCLTLALIPLLLGCNAISTDSNQRFVPICVGRGDQLTPQTADAIYADDVTFKADCPNPS